MAVVVSNHGGRQLDGSRASFDQLAEIVDAVGDRIGVLMDGGVQRRDTCPEGAISSAPRRSASAGTISILWLQPGRPASSGRSA